MMTSSTQSPDLGEQTELEDEGWEPEAWVYFIWIVLGYQVYCKIGYSKAPFSRYNQLIVGIPEQPFRIHLLPCLSVEQAKLFERMFHEHLKGYRTRGEWFSHPNVRHFSKVLRFKMREALTLFHTFGYETEVERIDLSGDRPVLYKNGFVSHVVESAGDVEEE
jgi:hypothetical protein